MHSCISGNQIETDHITDLLFKTSSPLCPTQLGYLDMGVWTGDALVSRLETHDTQLEKPMFELYIEIMWEIPSKCLLLNKQ